jgi:hypothetical protein
MEAHRHPRVGVTKRTAPKHSVINRLVADRRPAAGLVRWVRRSKLQEDFAHVHGLRLWRLAR